MYKRFSFQLLWMDYNNLDHSSLEYLYLQGNIYQLDMLGQFVYYFHHNNNLLGIINM
jgi:hypothetical protein